MEIGLFRNRQGRFDFYLVRFAQNGPFRLL